jgi:hypothetical protein
LELAAYLSPGRIDGQDVRLEVHEVAKAEQDRIVLDHVRAAIALVLGYAGPDAVAGGATLVTMAGRTYAENRP